MSKAQIQANSSSGATATAGPSSSSSSSSAGGSTSPANVLHVQPEKPQHYTYVANTPSRALTRIGHSRTPDVAGEQKLVTVHS